MKSIYLYDLRNQPQNKMRLQQKQQQKNNVKDTKY